MNSKQRILKNLKEMHVTYSDDIRKILVPGKNPDRLAKHWQKYPREFAAQYNMLLFDGKTCKDCKRCATCCTMYGSKETDTTCQWYPSRAIYNL